jgi:hypothetical protein
MNVWRGGEGWGKKWRSSVDSKSGVESGNDDDDVDDDSVGGPADRR